MIHSIQFTAVLGSHVSKPPDIRDLLMCFAFDQWYTPKWSKHVFDDWKSIMERKKVPTEQVKKRLENVTAAFPDADVSNCEFLIDHLKLPDLKDRHVLAVAIKTKANVILADNRKDYPVLYVRKFDLKVKSTDDFLTDIIDLNLPRAENSFRRLLGLKRGLRISEYALLEPYRSLGLTKAADFLHAFISFKG
jgi:predicted nucleic acid-binding protein